MSDIKAPVRSMADVLKGEIQIDKAGVVTVGENTFAKTLEGTGLTVENFEKVSEHISTLAAASVTAVGELATPVFATNKELDRVNVTIPTVKKDSVNVDYFRSKDYPNPAGGGVKTVHGVTQVRVDQYGTGNRGQVKAARGAINELAAEAFGSK